MSPGGRRIKALETAFEILAVLKENGQMSLAELSEQVDVTKGTAHTHLMTLQQNDLVEQAGERYRLGTGFITYGAHVKNRQLVFQAGKDPVRQLALKTGEICEIATEYDGKCVLLHRFYGENTINREYQQTSFEQHRYLHYGATGKSMLAQMSPERVDRIVDRYGLPAQTNKTITDRGTLFDELERIRERGYAYNDEEEIHGIRAVGTPILSTDGDCLGAICVAGPGGRIDDEQFTEAFPNLVAEARSLIEANVQTNDFDVFTN
ncbi:IclR family transcriptional regulator [Halostella pelagica]|uniref:IclR family transcriptional regulator n=1 Tax=Halostella pelagica TaxID=2583824 RepID=UPI001386EB74|nr:IclR family transcriptional regulator [Halostella pelagica]